MGKVILGMTMSLRAGKNQSGGAAGQQNTFEVSRLKARIGVIMKKVTPNKHTDSLPNQGESGLPKLAVPAQRALAAAGIQRLEQLTKFTEVEIRQLHGMGPNALGKLRQALADKGLSFADETKKK